MCQQHQYLSNPSDEHPIVTTAELEYDKLVAAHAVALRVTLVTNNEADFAGYPGLKVESWVASRL
jgi:hypothetical protein